VKHAPAAMAASSIEGASGLFVMSVPSITAADETSRRLDYPAVAWCRQRPDYTSAAAVWSIAPTQTRVPLGSSLVCNKLRLSVKR
jgi:hypothetical protein